MKHSRSEKHSRSWICEDCTVVFTVHTVLRKKPACPSCCLTASVFRYAGQHRKTRQYMKESKKIRYTDEELTVIDQVIAGKLLNYQAAIQLGRTIDSVNKRIARRRAALNK